LVAPQQLKAFMEILTHSRILYEIVVPDVEKIIEEQRNYSLEHGNEGRFDWENYQSLEDIQTFVKRVAAENPSFANVQAIGKTYEGRHLILIKISTGESGKRAIFIDGNIHAREWISSAVVTYIINELVTNAHQNLDLLSRFDFYIVPNVNPDGYAYTHSTSRLWRKTRSDHNSTIGCIGVDANRNWGYKWGGPGASPDKCSDTYMGPSQFSEPENDAIRNFILNTSVPWTYYFTFHSYSQFCLLPFADGIRPSDYEELMEKGNVFADALFGVYGTRYTVGNWEDVMYTSSGTSQDWAKAVANIKYSYTIELRDTGTYGFLLPPAQIKPTCLETWTGLKAMLLA